MKYGTVCSGIEAPSVAWEPLGWTAQWFSDIEPFPKAVLAHHYPDVPELGDMTKVKWNEQADIDVLIGGTPCQSFSVAGLRGGMDDPRGNLALEFLKIADIKRPRWVIWENVPGVLSSSGGRDFGSFLGALVQLGYGFAYRVLDAQYFGVPQRRRRVFVVGSLRGWASASAVLLERQSLQGNPAPSREAGKDPAQNADGRSHWSGGPHPSLNQSNNTGGIGMSNQELFSQHGCGLVSTSITSIGPPFSRTGNSRVETEALILTNGEGSDGATLTKSCFGKTLNNQTPLVAFNGDPTPKTSINVAGTMRAEQGGEGYCVATPTQIRRLTPVECERLQGFPDNYTRIPWRNKPAEDCPDGHRYKALGNSMAVPVIRWIGERIQAVEDIITEDES